MAEEKMSREMRVMTENPLNAETPITYLRSWITANSVFFDRNQNALMKAPIELSDWHLTISGEVEKELQLGFDDILRFPKTTIANTLECSGNGRSLLQEKAKGNPWTIGGVGNAVWGGIWLKDVLQEARLNASAKHVSFEGFDKPMGSAGIKFVRSIPIEKALSSTILAYEMNGEPLPLKHGYPLRALALGWTGANCVKWLTRIALLEKPFEGFFMDNVYRIFQKDQDPKAGEVVTKIPLKSIITQPLPGERLPLGTIIILGAAYGGGMTVERIEVSMDGGKTWHQGSFIGPNEPYAWRQWQFVREAQGSGTYTIMARVTDREGHQQPEAASWNVLGYGNNGVREHAVTVEII